MKDYIFFSLVFIDLKGVILYRGIESESGREELWSEG